MTLTHAPTIEVSVEDLYAGVGERAKSWWNWDTYLSTWKKVDGGEKNHWRMPLFKAMRKHYGRQSQERLARELEVLGLRSGDSEAIAREWVSRHIGLYRNIRKYGFDENKEKRIEIDIGSKGELVVFDGHNRVSILLHLKKPSKINVVVRQRAEEWVDLKERLYRLYDRKLLYQPMEHPDFHDWKVDRGCEDRFESIIKHLGDVRWKHVLDIGSCTGWFCRRLSERGAYAVGVEKHRARHEIARQFTKICGFGTRGPAYVLDSFENYLRNDASYRVDVVLFLSVFHHYLRRNLEEAWSAVRLISEHGQTMFMDLSLNNLPIEWNPKLVLENSLYDRYEELPSRGRPLYAFMRTRDDDE